MKRSRHRLEQWLFIAVALTVLAAAPSAQAQPFHLRIGAIAWHESPSGYIEYSVQGSKASAVYLQDGLGLGGTTSAYLHLTLTNSIPLVPNMRLAYNRFDQQGASVLNAKLRYGGNTYAAGTRVDSHLKLRQTTLALFYRPLTGRVTWRLGVQADFASASGTISDRSTGQSATASGAAVIPGLYTGLEIALPAGFCLRAQGAWISYGGTRFDSWQTAGTWTSAWGMGVEVGYRRENIKIGNRFDPDGNLSFAGVFGGVFYSF